MNPYEIEYRAKLATLEEALDSLKDGDIIGTSQCANEPTAFLTPWTPFGAEGKNTACMPLCAFRPIHL